MFSKKILREDFENTKSLLINEARNTLDTTGETTDWRVGKGRVIPWNVVTENLAGDARLHHFQDPFHFFHGQTVGWRVRVLAVDGLAGSCYYPGCCHGESCGDARLTISKTLSTFSTARQSGGRVRVTGSRRVRGFLLYPGCCHGESCGDTSPSKTLSTLP